MTYNKKLRQRNILCCNTHQTVALCIVRRRRAPRCMSCSRLPIQLRIRAPGVPGGGRWRLDDVCPHRGHAGIEPPSRPRA